MSATPGKTSPTFASAPLMATVIVPVYNDGDNLRRCLTALSASTCDGFEVLVVDDGSTENVQTLVEPFGYRVLRIDGPGGPARARNRGVAQVSSEVLVFVDADVCVHSDTVERFMQHFMADSQLAAVIGSYDDEPACVDFLSQYRNLYHHYIHSCCPGEVTTFWTGCGAMRREVFLQYGGFDEKRYARPMIEDIELGTWIAADGGRLLLDPQIQCKHLKRWSLSNIVRTDIFQRGIVWVDLMLRSGKVVQTLNVTWSQRVSVVLVFGAGVLLLLAVLWPWTLILAALSAATVTWINRDLYRFFRSRRNLWFALRSLPVHWLYFLCCGVSAIGGSLKYTFSKFRERKKKPLSSA